MRSVPHVRGGARTGVGAAALVAALVALASACGDSPTQLSGPRPPALLAVYDAAHANVWSVRDPGYFGFSEFGRELARAGWTVAEAVEPLDVTLARSAQLGDAHASASGQTFAGQAANGRGASLVVINVAKRLSFTPGEIEALLAQVRSGGSLLVFGEHDNMFGIADGLSPLLGPLGLVLGRSAVGKRRAEVRRAVSPHFRIDGVVEMLGARVRAAPGNPHDVLLASPHGAPLALGVRFGAGRVVLVGDSELFWNGDAAVGVGAGNNRRFLRRLLVYLAGVEETVVAARARTAGLRYAFGRGRRTAFFDTTASTMTPEVHEDGLSRLALALVGKGYRVVVGPLDPDRVRAGDVRVVAAPFRRVAPNSRGSLLVLGAARHTLSAENFWDRVLLERGARPPESPYLVLEKRFGFEFASCTQVDERGSWLLPLSAGGEPRLHRAGGFLLRGRTADRPSREPRAQVWSGLATASAARCVREHPGVAENSQRQQYAAGTPLPLAVSAGSFLFLADAHALTDRYAGSPAFERLVENICTVLGRAEK